MQRQTQMVSCAIHVSFNMLNLDNLWMDRGEGDRGGAELRQHFSWVKHALSSEMGAKDRSAWSWLHIFILPQGGGDAQVAGQVLR